MRISDWSSDVCSSDLRRPHCTARFRAITLEYRDFGQQQFKRDRRSNGATALHEFEPALGNFPGADQSVSLHFYPQPCNGDAFIEACQMKCRNMLTSPLGTARQQYRFGLRDWSRFTHNANQLGHAKS